MSEILPELCKNLTSNIRIVHICSTSITGMDAKPIIDIDIEISTQSDFIKINKELEKIEYVHSGDQGIKEQEAFIRVGDRKFI